MINKQTGHMYLSRILRKDIDKGVLKDETY